MPKVLSQAGTSLADVYDVEGSIAGVEELLSKDVSLVHEMGAAIFSERASAAIRRMTSTSIAQTLTWNVVLQDLPVTPARILGVAVVSDNASRISNAQVSVRGDLADREIPIFVFNGTAQTIIFQDDVLGLGTFGYLENVPGLAGLPGLLMGSDQPQVINEIAFRGLSTTFGAGTVEAIALIYIAFAALGGVSSYGLPIPGW